MSDEADDARTAADEPAATDERAARRAARRARLRAAILAGTTVGAMAVVTISTGPTTVTGHP